MTYNVSSGTLSLYTTTTHLCCLSCLHRRCTCSVELTVTQSADSFAGFKLGLKIELFEYLCNSGQFSAITVLRFVCCATCCSI